MSARRIYMDWNATAPLRPEARAAVIAAMDASGNPSSIHGEGRAARRIVTEARAAVAANLGIAPRNLIFTSGGTEANVLALTPGVRRGSDAGASRLLVSAIEHASVLAGGRFKSPDISVLKVDSTGIIQLDHLEEALAAGPPALVSIMLANNETGVLQPVSEAAALVHAHGGLLHVDAVQAFGKFPFSLTDCGADLLTLSAHKIGGPTGVGVLVLAEGVLLPEPLLPGGGQEMNLRGGTENVAAIAGFGAAVGAAFAGIVSSSHRMADLRNRLEAALLDATPQAVVFGRSVPRLPNTSLIAVPDLKAETAVISMDLAGVAVSSGSACSSGKVTRSHVLAAMGVPGTLAGSAIRFSLGWTTSKEDVDTAAATWRRVVGSLVKA